MIFTIFCKRAFFVTFIGVSFVIASCWSSWLNPLIMTLQPNATRSSNADPGNAGLNLPTVWPFYQVNSVLPISHRQGEFDNRVALLALAPDMHRPGGASHV